MAHLQAHRTFGPAAVRRLVESQAAKGHGVVHPAGGPGHFPAVFQEGEVGAEFLGDAALFVILDQKLIQAHLEVQGMLVAAHFKGPCHFTLVQGETALQAPELADEPPGQDQQQGQVHQIGTDGAVAAALKKIDFLVRQGLPAASPQLPLQHRVDAGLGIDAGGPVELAPLRQGQGRLPGEGRQGAPHRPGQSLDQAGRDVQSQQPHGHQEPGAVVDPGQTPAVDDGPQALPVAPEVLARRLVLRHHGADDRHPGQNQEQKDGETDGGQ